MLSTNFYIIYINKTYKRFNILNYLINKWYTRIYFRYSYQAILINKKIYPNTQTLDKKIKKIKQNIYKKKFDKIFNKKKHNKENSQKISFINRIAIYDDYKFLYYCNTKHRIAQDKYNKKVLKKDFNINYLIKIKKKKKVKILNTKLKLEKEKRLKAALIKFYKKDLKIQLNRSLFPKFKFFFNVFYNAFKYKVENNNYNLIQYYPNKKNEINKIRAFFIKKKNYLCTKVKNKETSKSYFINFKCWLFKKTKSFKNTVKNIIKNDKKKHYKKKH